MPSVLARLGPKVATLKERLMWCDFRRLACRVFFVSATCGLAGLLCFTLTGRSAQAADDLVLIEVEEAMQTPEFQQQLDQSIGFYFGGTPHPQVQHTYGNFTTNKKTNAFLKEAGVACRHVLLSALLALQNQAKSLGGNAVINIKSYFKRNEVSHDDSAECHKGFLMAGVALKGDVVRLAN